MRRAIVLLALAACSRDPDPPTKVTRTELVEPVHTNLLAGELPPGPETELVRSRCQICHAVEYLTQQRLGEAGWKKTIDKMRRFGATLTDDEAAALVQFAAAHWNPALAPRTWTPVGPPPGALPE